MSRARGSDLSRGSDCQDNQDQRGSGTKSNRTQEFGNFLIYRTNPNTGYIYKSSSNSRRKLITQKIYTILP